MRRVFVYERIASHISETNEAIAIKVDTVTASVTGMHHVLIDLELHLKSRRSRS